MRAVMAVRAVLFDLGNTLVRYYTPDEFPRVLRRCLRECAATLNWPLDDRARNALFERALALNREQANYAVRPLASRLQELFDPLSLPVDGASDRLTRAFLRPIFDAAVLDPDAHAVLDLLRRRGVRTAIVSNTPWGSPADLWREELARHGLLQRVDATVFCMDVGWRKPHCAPFDRALTRLHVAPSQAIFVGDDPRWDVAGALNAGLQAVLLGSTAEPTPSGVASISRLTDVLTLVETIR
jgi:putative hydrolase of the HAD superfamily